jgi:phage/plasmid primase-like uncharacterized protein
VIAGDNDHHLPRRETPLPNVGTEKATAASEAVSGVLLLPTFAPTDTGTDWNDVAAQLGRQAVREAARVELGRHGIELSAPLRSPERGSADRATASQAARDAARSATAAKAGAAARAPQESARQTQRQR